MRLGSSACGVRAARLMGRCVDAGFGGLSLAVCSNSPPAPTPAVALSPQAYQRRVVRHGPQDNKGHARNKAEIIRPCSPATLTGHLPTPTTQHDGMPRGECRDGLGCHHRWWSSSFTWRCRAVMIRLLRRRLPSADRVTDRPIAVRR